MWKSQCGGQLLAGTKQTLGSPIEFRAGQKATDDVRQFIFS